MVKSEVNTVDLSSDERGQAVSRNTILRILLLQGPVGPFFRKLQSHLNSLGHDTWRITFNAGDRVYAGRRKCIRYSGNSDGLQSWYRALLARNNFDCVILFGCDRPVHRLAVDLCTTLGIPVISLEEGYLRPGYVTVEPGGNNWRSPLAGRLPDDKIECRQQRRPDAPSSFAKMSWYALIYFVARALASHPRDRRLFHKRSRSGLLSEAFFWTRNYVRKQLRLSKNFGVMQRLLEEFDGRFFVVPFQVSDDSQLNGGASRGWSNESMALGVMESFARTAPADMRLVFKIHPLERGHADHWSLVNHAATLNNVLDRVDIVDSGSLGLLTRHSAGMVTINSTSGLSALYHGRPLAVLGEALYSHPKLTTIVESARDLDKFWSGTSAAPAACRKSYLEWIMTNCLVPGDFYLFSELKPTLDGVVKKVEAAVDTACRGQRQIGDVKRYSRKHTPNRPGFVEAIQIQDIRAQQEAVKKVS